MPYQKYQGPPIVVRYFELHIYLNKNLAQSTFFRETLYRTRAIITRGLYFLPHFSVQVRLILQTL